MKRLLARGHPADDPPRPPPLAPAADEPSLRIRDTFFMSQGMTPPLGPTSFEHRVTYQMYEGPTALDTVAMAVASRGR